MGEKALDRSAEVHNRYPPTTAGVLIETGNRLGINAAAVFINTAATIDPGKYRSQRRKDQLVAVARLLMTGTILFPGTQGNALRFWNTMLLPVFFVPVWDYPTGFCKTSIQRQQPP